jgi:hypothetical protein
VFGAIYTKARVLQGSTLDPVLFGIYINHIPSDYAVDTNLIMCSGINMKFCIQFLRLSCNVARETEKLNTEFKNVQQDAEIQY